MMKYGSRPRHARNKLLQTVFCSYTLLVLFFLHSDLVSAQFVLRSFDNTNITCTGNSTLSNSGTTLPGAICLAPNNLSNNSALAGRCVYNKPISAQWLPSFSTMFSFNTLVFPGQPVGQGFTFFIGPDNTSVGESGGYLGWLNSTTNGNTSGHNFAVEFDIVNNSLSEGFGVDDPNYPNHVGINVNNLNSTYIKPVSYNLSTDSSGERLYAWIDYDRNTGRIDVSLSPDKRKPCKPLFFHILNRTSLRIDSSETFLLYVGFTSSSGNGTNAQTTIWDWSFNTNGKAHNIYEKDDHCGGSENKWIIISVAIIVVVGAVVFLVVGLLFVLHRRTRKISDLERENLDLEEEKAVLVAELKQLDYGAREFTYQELRNATKEFQEEIGSGGFGNVYKGTLYNLRSSRHPNGDTETIVAVKKIKRTAQSIEDAKQLVAEVQVIGRLRHINIVPLLGWCYERGEMLLVYKYMENGDLHMHLFPSDKGTPVEEVLSWTKRMRILRGVAAAMVFLHEEFEYGQRVIHRDVKPRNVMIDRSFNARLGDFGLARLYDRNSNSKNHTEVLVGTRGYIAPEYMEMGATTKTDVYSFGVLALVVATGRHALPSTLREGLVTWVRHKHDMGALAECKDVQLEHDKSFELQEMERVLRVGLACCLYDPEVRLSMREVLTALQGMPPKLSSPLPPQNPQQVSSIALNSEFLAMVSGSSQSSQEYTLTDSEYQQMGRSSSYLRSRSYDKSRSNVRVDLR